MSPRRLVVLATWLVRIEQRRLECLTDILERLVEYRGSDRRRP